MGYGETEVPMHRHPGAGVLCPECPRPDDGTDPPVGTLVDGFNILSRTNAASFHQDAVDFWNPLHPSRCSPWQFLGSKHASR